MSEALSPVFVHSLFAAQNGIAVGDLYQGRLIITHDGLPKQGFFDAPPRRHYEMICRHVMAKALLGLDLPRDRELTPGEIMVANEKLEPIWQALGMVKHFELKNFDSGGYSYAMSMLWLPPEPRRLDDAQG